MCCPKEEQKTIYNDAARIVKGFMYMAGGVNEELSKERMGICYQCTHIRAGISCEICGCILKAKTTLNEEACPIGRWKAVEAKQ